MALMNKPDESIFASSAKQGEVDNFPDLLRGWGITFDQTQGIPPMEWFNFLFKRMDEKHAYLMQRGLPEWSATQDYAKGSCVQFDGLSYRALKAGKNNKPNESDSQYWVRWGFTLAEIARATLTQYGLTQLYTGYDSQREDLALTPKTAYQLKQLINSNTRSLGNFIPNSKKSSRVDSNSAEDVATSVAVKTAYDKGVEAKDAADNANQNAEGRVSKSGDTITGKLRINAVNTSSWSALEMGTNQGKWTLEVNPHSHEAGQRRFNVFYDGGGKRTYLAFPHVGDNGDTVAYQSWVEGSYLPLTGGKITGNLEINRGNDYASVILHNKSKFAMIESTPDSDEQFLNLIYRTNSNQNLNIIKVPKKTGTMALNDEFVGMVAFFARTTPPSGWLKANGAAVSRTTYAALFAAIGTTFGAGDGRTTFNLPDLRGEFIRGLDDGRNIDIGRRLGTAQGDAIRNITGKLDGSAMGSGNQVLEGKMIASGAIGTTYQQRQWSGDQGGWGEQSVSFDFDASRVVPIANENRPRNVALLACIKY